jgi:hypothetical protein
MAYLGSTPTTQSFIAGTDSFNGTGSATNFTLSRSVNSVNDIQVVVNNVVQYPPNYSVSGTTLTISPAPSSGTNNVYVRYLSTTLQTITPSDLTVSAAKIQTSAVTTDKIADANITAAKLNGAQSGSAPIYAARAWVNFNGSGTVAISASGNVSSITDNASGDYTVNFTTAMSDANYCIVAMGRRPSGSNPNSGYGAIVSISSATAPTTTATRIWTTAVVASGTASSIVQVEDFPNVNIAVFR